MLIKCAECGCKVSDKASTCPHCGAPVECCYSQSTSVSTSDHKPQDDEYSIFDPPPSDVQLLRSVSVDSESVIQYLDLKNRNPIAFTVFTLNHNVPKDHACIGSAYFLTGIYNELSPRLCTAFHRILSSPSELLMLVQEANQMKTLSDVEKDIASRFEAEGIDSVQVFDYLDELSARISSGRLVDSRDYLIEVSRREVSDVDPVMMIDALYELMQARSLVR